MVLYNGLQLGKPKDEEEAFNMLLMLQDHVHEVITAYTIYQGGKELVTRAVSAHLYIEKMADLEIREYIETGSPMDKAGAYGVQDKDFITSRIIDGDEYTIMGLPLFDLEDDLYSLGILNETKTTLSVLGRSCLFLIFKKCISHNSALCYNIENKQTQRLYQLADFAILNQVLL